VTALEPGRRQALLSAKLRALVRDRWGAEGAQPQAFGDGAALWDPGTERGWVLADGDAADRVLGPALAWGVKAGASELHVLVEGAGVAGTLARRAALFATPPAVWVVEGRSLREAAPGPPFADTSPTPELLAFADDIRAAGADVVVEHGLVKGEVLGLEVARVVVDDAGAHLQVGVDRHDRAVHGMRGLPPRAALAEVVGTVRARRRRDAEHHPLRQLAPERWLRAVLVADPALAGAAELAPVPSSVTRDDLHARAPAFAAGEDDEGGPVVVACSVGVDLDVVPVAADARLADGRPGCRLRIVVPGPDALPVTARLAASLRDPAEVVTVEPDWRRP
jgi:hypothetical protein